MNKKDTLIFCHIPKTAGSSLRTLLAKQGSLYGYRHPREKEYMEYSPAIKNAIGGYRRGGYMNLDSWIDSQEKYTHPYDIDTFDFSYVHIPNIEFWEYWLYNIPDSKRCKFIELHLNKTSLIIENYFEEKSNSYLYNYFDPHPIFQRDDDKIFSFSSNNQNTITDYTISLPNNLCENKLYEKFNWLTILRNPTERIISEYYFLGNLKVDLDKMNLNIDNVENLEIRAMSSLWNHLPFSAVDSLEGYHNSPYTQNTQVKMLLGKGFLNNCKVTENDYDRLIETMERLDFKVGIQSKMKESIIYFNKSLGLNMDIYNIPYEKNQTNIKPIINDDVKNKIKENNKWDFKLYNYFSNKLDEVL